MVICVKNCLPFTIDIILNTLALLVEDPVFETRVGKNSYPIKKIISVYDFPPIVSLCKISKNYIAKLFNI